MKKIGKKKKIFLIVLLLAQFFILFQFSLSTSFDGNYLYYAGQKFELKGQMARSFGNWLQYEMKNGDADEDSGALTDLLLKEPGHYQLGLKLFGIVPVKSVSVSVAPAMELVPGGQSVGIIMKTDGVVIVGFSSIPGEDGKMLYPSKDADIQLGDSILKINGIDVASDDQAAELIDRFGVNGSVEIELRQGNEVKTKTVETIKCPETGTYRIGLYIRDDTGGIGTLTFYDKTTGRFGALGHKINDTVATGDITQMQNNEEELLGRLMPANISGIVPGEKGRTGEKIGYFNPGAFDGEIDTIGEFGAFGHLNQDLENNILPTVLPARPDQVKEGPAQIFTVIEGNKMESFDIEIVSIDRNADKKSKGLIIEVTDERLLAKTGGIIQGMSGSPIIQDGLLVGAVTHVLVNHPNKGYGCLIDCMLSEAGLI